jgi:hypothetical protein
MNDNLRYPKKKRDKVFLVFETTITAQVVLNTESTGLVNRSQKIYCKSVLSVSEPQTSPVAMTLGTNAIA